MASDHALYRDLAYVFIAALLGGVIAKRLRQPLIIGYVLGGIFIPSPARFIPVCSRSVTLQKSLPSEASLNSIVNNHA